MKDLVTIMLPVYNGDQFLRNSLSSILNQSYKNFELIILDNKSNDMTADICKEYQEIDKRIKYILDEKNRTANEAQTYLSNLIKGEYCLLVGDDDQWDEDYISRLVSFLEENKNIKMVYTKMHLFDINNIVISSNLPETILKKNNSIFKNLSIYLVIRSCVPMVFGLFRSKEYKANGEWKIFDQTLTDVDNLFMINFLSKNKVNCINESKFYYRQKIRNFQKKGSANLLWQGKTSSNKISLKYKKIKHEFYFLIETIKVLKNAKVLFYEKIILYLISIVIFFERSFVNQSKFIGSNLRKIIKF